MTGQVEHIAPKKLRVNPRNPRTHSRLQVQQIADSISYFGFTNPILIDSDNMVLAGHGRLAAATLLRLPKVPCLRLDNMTAEQKRVYVIADNKLGLNSRWDEQLLADELRELVALDPDFDVTVTGYLLPEIDSLLDETNREDPGDPRDDRLPGHCHVDNSGRSETVHSFGSSRGRNLMPRLHGRGSKDPVRAGGGGDGAER